MHGQGSLAERQIEPVAHRGVPSARPLAEIGKRLGRKILAEVACVAKPETILAWYRKLVAKKFDGSKHRQYPCRSTVQPEVETLVVKMARENNCGIEPGITLGQAAPASIRELLVVDLRVGKKSEALEHRAVAESIGVADEKFAVTRLAGQKSGQAFGNVVDAAAGLG